MYKKYLFLLIALNFGIIYGQTTIKTMFYNLLNYPTAPPSNREDILKNILNTYEPDIFMVCELESDIAANGILTNSFANINKNYSKAQFVTNQSDTTTDSDLQQLIFYNSDFLILDNQETVLTNIRDINHYTFILKTINYLTNPTYLEIFVTHLKSSQGTTNQQKRLAMVEQFTSALSNLNANSFVIFAGDFNFYTSSEPAYQKILDSGNSIIMKDVLNLNNNLQSWHNNYSWRNLHTQATRLSNSEFNGHGAYGGLDDRFDFIMLSENMLSNSDIHYVSNSYQNYGNNGNCYNKRIDDTDCNGSFDQNLRDLLYDMSDHLPVTLKIETNQTLATQNDIVNKNLIQFNYGNIINDALSLSINESIINKTLYIYNSIGQKVFETKLKSTHSEIDISSLSEGIYLIKLDNNNLVLKFIKK
jgi:hypothetical protein